MGAITLASQTNVLDEKNLKKSYHLSVIGVFTMTLTINSFKDFFQQKYADFAEQQEQRSESRFNFILGGVLAAGIDGFTGNIVVHDNSQIHGEGQRAKSSKKLHISPYNNPTTDLCVSVKRFFLGVAFDKLQNPEDFRVILQQGRRITVHVATDGSIASHSYEQDSASLPVRLFHRILTPLSVFF
ncbi:MAG: hypothetical protein K2X08_02500 [Chlamydiales bacterium]|nr:hypothetical protein [Chlamydiales bacterium]